MTLNGHFALKSRSSSVPSVKHFVNLKALLIVVYKRRFFVYNSNMTV